MKNYFKRGLILIYPGYHNEAKIYQYNRIAEEFEKQGILIDKLKVDDVIIDIQKEKMNLEIEKYDFCIQLVKDKYIDTLLKKANIRTFNSYASIENCDDKMMTYCLLADNNIKMPATISGIMNTGIENILDTSINENLKKYVEESLGYPLIIKKCYSKGGKDVYKIDNDKQFDEICNKLNGSKYLFQEYIFDNIGKDIRTIVVGGRYVTSIMRVNEKDFRSNISLGGKAFKYDVTEKYKELAEKVAKILKLDYCSVDFFFTESEPIICEVNADPALMSIEKICDINLAQKYVKYVIDEVYKN